MPRLFYKAFIMNMQLERRVILDQSISLELFSSKRFGKYINNLVLSFAGIHDDVTFIHVVPEKVMIDIYMFGLLLLDRVLCHIDSTCMVSYYRLASFFDSKILKLLFYP